MHLVYSYGRIRGGLRAFGAALIVSIASANDPPANYHLFVGRDLSLKLDETFHPVRNVIDDQVEVGEVGNVRDVPLIPLPQVLVQTAVKLTSTLVTIENLEPKRVISPTSRVAAERDSQNSRLLRHMEDELRAGEKNRGDFGPRERDEGERPSLKQLTSNLAYETALDQIDQHVNRTFLNDSDYGEDAPYDALQISARLTSPLPLEGAYAVWVCTFTARQSEFARIYQNVYLRPLPQLDDHPRRISTRLDGFPEHFEMKELKVSIFLGTTELATNLSERRFALTLIQAHQYLVTDYITRHQRQDVERPSPANELGLKPILSAATSVLQGLAIEINAFGEVSGLRLINAPAGTALDPYINAVQELPFYPAIRDGKPVAGEYLGSLSLLQ